MTNRIIHLRTVAGNAEYATGIGDIALSGNRIYSTNAHTGGIGTWSPGGGIVATDLFGGRAGGAAGLTVLGLTDGPSLLSTGHAGGAARLYEIGAGGVLSAPRALDFGTSPVLAATAMTLGGKDLLYTACIGGRGIDVWRLTEGGMARLGTADMGGNAATYDLTALTAATVGPAHFVIATSSVDAMLSVFHATGTGALRLTDRLVPSEGFYVSSPEVLTSVTYSGETFVLAGSAGSGSLSVTSLNAAGQLTVRDQVNDQLGTRFASPTALEAIVMGGHAFAAIAGGDDGVTLFRLLPDGRLLLLDAFEDTAGHGGTALGDVTGLALRAVSGGLEIYAAGREDTGISQFRVDLGTLGRAIEGTGRSEVLHGTAAADVILGGGGSDTLYGGTGADVLVDGAGIDRLFGGGAADIFSLRADGEIDVIGDFEVGRDRLDLSEWGPVTPIGMERFYSTATGAEIMWRGERLVLYSADGRPIPPAALTPFFDGFSHVMTDPITGPQVLLGTLGEDFIVGSSGADRIEGWGGADHLVGGAGNDTILGERSEARDAIADLVFRIYQTTLNRAPDPGGLADWVAVLEDGSYSVPQVIHGFVASREFQSVYGATTPSAFVDLLYENVLGRAGNPAGRAFWTDQITSGRMSRIEVVQGFATSPELEARTAHDALEATFAFQQAGWTDEVFRLFRTTLGRAPGTDGLAFWSDRMTRGMDLGDVIGGFVGSAEFRAAYGTTTDAQFVALLYRNVLGRAGNPEGQAWWAGQLASGARDRTDVVTGFSESAEMQASSAAPMKAWMRASMADDRLAGEGGLSTLMGGIGADTFVFDPATGGTHYVTDFEDWDRLDFSGFGYTRMGQVHARLTYDGQDTVFLDQNVRIVLEDVRPASLTSDDFIFG